MAVMRLILNKTLDMKSSLVLYHHNIGLDVEDLQPLNDCRGLWKQGLSVLDSDFRTLNRGCVESKERTHPLSHVDSEVSEAQLWIGALRVFSLDQVSVLRVKDLLYGPKLHYILEEHKKGFMLPFEAKRHILVELRVLHEDQV